MINRFPTREGIIGKEREALTLNTLLEMNIWINPFLNTHFGQVEPPANNRKDGLIAYADGTNWNPGGGEGYYRYETTSASWLPINVMAAPLTTKTASYTATAHDGIILVDATAGAITITLPTAVGIKGKEFKIKKTDGTANAVTIDGNGAQTIDGAATRSLALQYESLSIVSDNTNWGII